MTGGSGPVLRDTGRRLHRLEIAAALGVILVGAGFSLANADLPIVRNALLYAQIHEALAAHGMKLWQVCPDPTLAFNKACGFAALAAPWVPLLGVSNALKLSSALGALAFVVAAWMTCRQFADRFALDRPGVALALLLSTGNALLIYQFWSAYPDTLSAALYLFSLVALDRLVTGRGGWPAALAIPLLFMAGMVVKHSALFLIPTHLVYLLWNHRRVAAAFREKRPVMVVLTAGYVAALAFWVTGLRGLNPLLNLVTNLGQMRPRPDYAVNLATLALALLSTLGPFVLLLPAIRVTRRDGFLMTAALAFVVLTIGYHGAANNIRYFLPILPLLALYLVRAFARVTSQPLRNALVVAFLVGSAAATVLFNERHVYRRVAAARPGPFREMATFDNFRMGAHLEAAAAIAEINLRLPPGSWLVYVTNYYGAGGVGVYENSGLFRPDIQIAYLSTIKALRKIDLDPRGAFFYFQPPARARPMKDMVSVAERLYRMPAP